MNKARGKPLDGAAVAAAWADATSLWGVQMRDPLLMPEFGYEVGSFAWFDMQTVQTHVDPVFMAQVGVIGELSTIFAHEIGHHVIAPATRIDALKILHQMARALAAVGDPRPHEHMGELSNLWNDLLVNARVETLQRNRDGDGSLPGIIRTLAMQAATENSTRLYWVYMRTYERLWNLPAGTLAARTPPPAPPRVPLAMPLTTVPAELPDRFVEQERKLREARAESVRITNQLRSAVSQDPEFDASRLADMVRAFALDPISGALAAGVVLAPYVLERTEQQAHSDVQCRDMSQGATPAELGQVFADRRLWDAVEEARGSGSGQEREAGMMVLSPDGDPIDLGPRLGQGLGLAATLKVYADMPADAVAVEWYQVRARQYVRAWTTKRAPTTSDDLMGPLEQWEVGDDLAEIDWPGTFRGGPQVIPGVTTRRRASLEEEPLVREGAITLDLYVDSSGSMPRPLSGSPALLAGAILCLSILKGGGQVRVTSFSGPGQVAGSAEFSRKPAVVLGDLLHYFGGGTTFPLDLYERRYHGLSAPGPHEARHVVVLSDDGLVSMFGQGNEAYAQVAAQVRSVLTTGTLVVIDRWPRPDRPALRDGYTYLYLENMDDAPAACAELAKVLRG